MGIHMESRTGGPTRDFFLSFFLLAVFKSEALQQKLTNVLAAYSNYHDHIGELSMVVNCKK